MKTLKTQLSAVGVTFSTSQQVMSHNHGPAPAVWVAAESNT